MKPLSVSEAIGLARGGALGIVPRLLRRAQRASIGQLRHGGLGHRLRSMGLVRPRRPVDSIASFVADTRSPAWIDEMVGRADRAQQEFADWPEERVMPLLRDVARTIADRAESLARDTVDETGMGVVEHKIVKIRFGSLIVLASLEGRESCGLLSTSRKGAILEVASSIGVVLGLIPVTNPIPTFSFKALICLKSRNALIASIHRGAATVGARVEDLMRDVLRRHGAPEDLIQLIRRQCGRETAMQFMRHEGVGLILATGGPGMVKAAYGSGTPAIVAGPGNAPCWVSAKADVAAAAKLIVDSKSFDNGIVCGSENNLLVDRSVRSALLGALEREGAVVLRSEEIGPFTDTVFDRDGGALRKCFVGQPAARIGAAAGLSRTEAARLLVMPLERSQVDSPMTREKLAPVLSAITVRGPDDAIDLARHILLHRGGIGHTAIVHSNDDDEIRRFGAQVPASRILVNDRGSQGCIGLTNGLTPSLTLGCGTGGGGSTTDNISFQHLMNVRRIAYPT